MSLESTIRGVLTNKQAPKEQEKVEVKESKEEKVVQFISSLNEAKDPEEYDQEGDMMKSQLRQIDSAIDKLMGMVKDDDNLPEWVQSKMTKATDYIRSVRDYLESEKMNEEWVCGKCNCDPCTCEESLQEGINQKKFAAGAKAMKAYAMKHGGVDKADFMKVADSLAKISRINLLQAGQELSRLNRLVDNQDTDVRERIYVELKKVGLVEALEEKFANPAQQAAVMAKLKKDGKYKEEVEEKTLTPAELKKREEIAKAIERENPDMPMPQKMAIATAQAKKTAEAYDEPQGQAKRMMSPLQKARMDKEKADRDRDGKLKPGVTKEEVALDEAMNAASIEKAMRKALKDRGNYKNGKVNWNFIDADTYMEVKPGRAQVKQFYRMFDQIASKLTKEMDLKEDISEAKKVTSMQIHKVLAKTKNSREGIAALKKAFRVNDMEAKKMFNQVMNEDAYADDAVRRHQSALQNARAAMKNAKSHDAMVKAMNAVRFHQKAIDKAMHSESTFVSKFKEELKEKKRGMSETKGAPKGYHFTRSGQLKKGDAGQDGPGGKMLRSDPLDKQRKKIPPLPENDK